MIQIISDRKDKAHEWLVDVLDDLQTANLTIDKAVIIATLKGGKGDNNYDRMMTSYHCDDRDVFDLGAAIQERVFDDVYSNMLYMEDWFDDNDE